MVYVLNRFAAQIVAVDVKKMAVVKTWRALREPFAAALGLQIPSEWRGRPMPVFEK